MRCLEGKGPDSKLLNDRTCNYSLGLCIGWCSDTLGLCIEFKSIKILVKLCFLKIQDQTKSPATQHSLALARELYGAVRGLSSKSIPNSPCDTIQSTTYMTLFRIT